MNKNFLFGLHVVHTLLKEHPERVIELHLQDGRNDKKMATLIHIANEHQIAVNYLTKQELDRMTHDAHHQGIVAVCAKAQVYNEQDLLSLIQKIKDANETPFLLILDGIQDPHNLGACFRSAEAAGVHAIIAPKDKSVGLTPIVSKVASGAAETIPFIQVTNLARTLEALKAEGIWIYGAAAEATQLLYEADLKGAVAIVLGAEGAGLRRLTRECCDQLLQIPMQGRIASLNVSVATGIFLFEVVRQKLIR